MPKHVTKLACYAPGSDTCVQWLTREDCRQLVDEGAARWINRAKAIRLHKRDDAPKVHDNSCQMGPRVTEAVWDQKPWALAIADGWAPNA